MKLSDPSTALLAACANDTVKLFDISAEPADPCTLSYTPAPGCLINSLKWNHTNLVVASAGDDKRISLWRSNGQSLGTIPVSGTDSGDGIEESMMAINFSNKSSRYICSGGTGHVVRIWDLQRKRCIKWLRGHTDTITGVAYNCKDEYLASISLKGDLILHNLASGARTTEYKDPNEQVLRVLDYSRISRHLLITAGDDGSMHLWDTTGRSPKISWLKQHSAPVAGVGFSPSHDKTVASVGLDKKLYLYDSGSKRPSSCIPYEAPFSSLAYRDDGWVLAAGTSNGRVVFYDVRGKPQPLTVLRAYNSSEAVTSLSWQRSKPVSVSESCTAQLALLGSSVEESVLMPDPLPSVPTANPSLSTSISGLRPPGRSGLSSEYPSLTSTSSSSLSNAQNLSSAEETPQRNPIWPGGKLSRLHAPRSSYNFKDDMEVFSPLVDVHPVTPQDKLWDDHEGTKKDQLPADKRPSSLLFPSSLRRFPFKEDGANDHPAYDWKSSLTSKQDDAQSSFIMLDSSLNPFSKAETTSITPPEAWGGERFSDKVTQNRQSINLPSRSSSSGLISEPISSSAIHSTINSLTTPSLGFGNSLNKDATPSLDIPTDALAERTAPSAVTAKSIHGQTNLEFPSLNLPRRFSTYAERISTNPAFADGTALATGSPKLKKTGAEARDELLNSLLLRSDPSAAIDLPTLNGGGLNQTPKSLVAQQDGSSFTHQLFQRTLEETLSSFQKSIHEDMRNLHIEVLRQFHIQETEFSSAMGEMLQNQAELMKEVIALRRENQQLRQLL
uniref:Protein NEDD1 n=1 Tax=Kalanchoe fedtschenkoi TaxID=63787 RepID=A0A7N0UNQ2_KALFE